MYSSFNLWDSCSTNRRSMRRRESASALLCLGRHLLQTRSLQNPSRSPRLRSLWAPSQDSPFIPSPQSSIQIPSDPNPVSLAIIQFPELTLAPLLIPAQLQVTAAWGTQVTSLLLFLCRPHPFQTQLPLVPILWHPPRPLAAPHLRFCCYGDSTSRPQVLQGLETEFVTWASFVIFTLPGHMHLLVSPWIRTKGHEMPATLLTHGEAWVPTSQANLRVD